jgi:glycine dehydrogenase subunit 1
MDNSEKQILDCLKIDSAEKLFSDIPQDLRISLKGIKNGISEMELLSEASLRASKNSRGMISFLGNGIYDRFVPASVDYVIGRSEFLTAYTPYQPEMSQGMLQSLFEYQSLICDLTEMDITNSSMYDGSTALGEAMRMAYRINGKKKVLVPENILLNHLSVLRNYASGIYPEFEFYKMDNETGEISIEDLESRIDDDCCCVIIYNPNCYGIVESKINEIVSLKKSALLLYYYDPVSLGLLKSPGELGVDIAIAEGQGIGINQNFGGPTLGLFSFMKEYARKSPGRIIGRTTDKSGKTAYVMTLQTREQHIRRDKATSNICTNQALMSIASSVYLSIVGSKGLKRIASNNFANAKYLQKKLSNAEGIDPCFFKGTYFSDVVVGLKKEVDVEEELLIKNILGGKKASSVLNAIPEKDTVPHFFTVTEKRTHDEIDFLSGTLEVMK